MIGLECILQLHNISLTQLSSELNITRANFYNWINGKRKIPKKYLELFEEKFNIPQDYFQKELTEHDKIKIQSIKIKNEQEKSYGLKFDTETVMTVDEFAKELEIFRGDFVRVKLEKEINCYYLYDKFNFQLYNDEWRVMIRFFDDVYNEQYNNDLAVSLNGAMLFEKSEEHDLVESIFVELGMDLELTIQRADE